MSTPTKNLTYLDGLYLRFERSPENLARVTKFRETPILRLLPDMWRPLYYLGIQGRLEIQRPVTNLDFEYRATPVLTLFWRKKQYRPPRGQLWPLTR